MKKIILLILLVYLSFSDFARSQNCEGFEVGTFEIKGDYGTIIVERYGEWQLEKSIEYNIMYLNRVEKISNCEFTLIRHKVIKEGIISIPKISDTAKIKILEVKKDEYFFELKFKNSEIRFDKYKKLSNDISDFFKNILSELPR
jgi:hypothetical protein